MVEAFDAEGKVEALLTGFVQAHGEEGLSDPAALEQWATSYGPGPAARREISLLVAAARGDVASQLRQQALLGPEGAVEHVAASFAHRFSLEPHAARWAVRSFACELGLLPRTPQIPGAKAAALCPSGHPVPPGALYCTSCGQAVAAPALAPHSPAVVAPRPPATTTLGAPAAAAPAGGSPAPGARPLLYRRPPRAWPWILGVAVALLALGGGALAGVELSSHHGSAGPSPTTTSSATTSVGTTTSPATTAPDPVGASQAQALDGLLSQSASDRASVVDATNDVSSCGDLAADISTLDQAAAARQGLLDQLSQLSVSALPEGSQLVEDLNTAWDDSLRSDDLYAAWAIDESNGCVISDTADPHFLEAQQLSAQATTAKEQVAELWAPIASLYDLPAWTASQI